MNALKILDNPFEKNFVSEWLRFLQVTPSTILAYEKSLKRLEKFFAEHKISLPTFENLLDFRDELIKNNSPATAPQ